MGYTELGGHLKTTTYCSGHVSIRVEKHWAKLNIIKEEVLPSMSKTGL